MPAASAQGVAVAGAAQGEAVPAGDQGAAISTAAQVPWSEGLFGPAPPPALLSETPRAILLEDGTLRVAADDGAEEVAELPAGTILEYVGSRSDPFGREWSIVRDPFKVALRREVLLAPFGARQLEELATPAAFLLPPAARRDRAPAGGSGPQETAWWTRIVPLGPEYMPAFGEVVGVDSRTVPLDVARRAIELLGGQEALGSWPRDPLPGQLHAPALLPFLYRWDGERWILLQPVRYLAASLGLLGNPLFRLDTSGPLAVGGPPVPCWTLVGALDASGVEVGTVQEARAPRAAEPDPESWRADPATGWRDLSTVAWPAAPRETAVPERVVREAAYPGISLRDNDRRQAVRLEQTLGSEITRRLRGAELSIEVWARAPAGAATGATVGIDVATGGERFSEGGEVGERTTVVSLSFTVPEEAEELTVRLLPLDPSLAVEGQGTVILERAVLRLAEWPQALAGSFVELRRVTISAYQGVPRYVRAPLALTTRDIDQVARIWPQVAASDWSNEDKQLVLAGQVRTGMTPEQVELSWGEPLSIAAVGEVPGLDLRWDYEDRSAVFDGGRMAAYSIRRPPPPAQKPFRCPGAGEAPDGIPGARRPGLSRTPGCMP